MLLCGRKVGIAYISVLIIIFLSLVIPPTQSLAYKPLYVSWMKDKYCTKKIQLKQRRSV